MRVLIVKMSAIGDVALAQPFLISLRESFPRARITWLAEEPAAGVLAENPFIDGLLISPRKRFLAELKKGRLGAARRIFRDFSRQLRAVEYDLAIDLQGLFKSGMLVWLCRAGRKLGHANAREQAPLFYDEKMPAFDPERHALLRYLDAAVYLGARVDYDRWSQEPSLKGYPQAAARAMGLVDLQAGERLVAVNPNASWDTKAWAPEAWAEVVRVMAGWPGLRLVMTGAPADAGYNRRVRELAGVELVDLTGRTSLAVLAEVYRACRLVISPDTGPMHIAAAVGTPVVALFGPTAPGRNGPFGAGHTVIRLGLACSPCFKRACSNRRCMTGITPEMVIEAARDKLLRA